MAFLWISMMFFLIFLWAAFGISIGLSRGSGILVDSHEVSMEPLWHFYGISMVFLWDFLFSIGFS